MADVHAVAAWPPSSVEVERLTLLVAVQYEIQLAMAKDYPSPEKPMGSVACDTLEPSKQVWSDWVCAELLDQLVVIDGKELPLLVDSAGHIERCDLLLDRLGRRCFVGE